MEESVALAQRHAARRSSRTSRTRYTDVTDLGVKRGPVLRPGRGVHAVRPGGDVLPDAIRWRGGGWRATAYRAAVAEGLYAGIAALSSPTTPPSRGRCEPGHASAGALPRPRRLWSSPMILAGTPPFAPLDSGRHAAAARRATSSERRGGGARVRGARAGGAPRPARRGRGRARGGRGLHRRHRPAAAASSSRDVDGTSSSRYAAHQPALHRGRRSGGYGRGELNPRSDIDLLFLYPWKVNPYVETVAEVVPLRALGRRARRRPRACATCASAPGSPPAT